MKKLFKILFSVFISFTFFGCKKDNESISIKDKPGTINVEEDTEEEEKVIITNDNLSKFTENGIEFRNISVVSLNTIFPIPDAFNIVDASDPFNVRFSSDKKEYENIQIGAMNMRNYVVNPISETGYFTNANHKLASSIVFPITAGHKLTLPSLEVAGTTLKTSMLYSNKEVHVLYEAVDYELPQYYTEYDEIPSDMPGTFLLRKHFYGQRNYGTLPASSLYSESPVSAKVYCNFLFRVEGSTEYIYYVLAPITKTDLADSIAKTLITHARQDTPVTGTTTVPLKYQEVYGQRLRVPDTWNVQNKAGITIYTNDDINSATFGTSIFVTQILSESDNFQRHAKIVDLVYDAPELLSDKNTLINSIPFVAETTDTDITFSLIDEHPLMLTTETEIPLKCTYRKIKTQDGVDTILGIFYKEAMTDNALKIYKSIVNSMGQ